jgi:hypothetical protein
LKIWLRTRNYVQRSILDSARRTSHVPLPAISSFEGLRTPAPECVAPSSWAGIRKPSQRTPAPECVAPSSWAGIRKPSQNRKCPASQVWPLTRGFSPAGYPTEPLVSYQINRQFSGWNPPPLVIRAFGAHCQAQTLVNSKGKLLRRLLNRR